MKNQTFNLLKKEIKLGNTAQSMCWLICCFGMFFIPSYPSYVGPFYLTLCIMMTFALNQSSHDILYTVLLPVRKIDTVKARFLYCGLIEIFALVLGIIPFVLHRLLPFPENRAGIPLNIAFFGLQLIVFAVFNFIFLGNVYKNPLKPGLRFILAAIGYFATYALCEVPVWAYFSMSSKLKAGEITELSALALFGSKLYDMDSAVVTQVEVFVIGSLIFAASWFITFRRAARQFESYDI